MIDAPDSFEDDGADSGAARPRSRRRLRAAFAADVAGFSRIVSTDETLTLGGLTEIREVAREELAAHDGWLFGMPGDGIFALFESALDAVACALRVQSRLGAAPEAGEMRLRIGIHMGEVLFDGDLPFGQTLAIAARLEALAPPGGVLVSGPVRDAVAHRVNVGFRSLGAPELKNIPLRLEVLEVVARHARHDAGRMAALDQTMGMPLLGSRLAEIASPPAAETPTHETPTHETPTPERQPTRVAELERLLTRHAGPVAGLLVARALASGRSLTDVAEEIALGIPSDDERAAFRAEAARLLGEEQPRG